MACQKKNTTQNEIQQVTSSKMESKKIFIKKGRKRTPDLGQIESFR